MRTIKSSVVNQAERKKADIPSAFSFCPDFSLEKLYIQNGSIAGIDEAGRGALAGPLSVGFVIFPLQIIENPPDEMFSLINDSKKLTPHKRNLAFDYIRSTALYSDVVLVSHATVDRLNINRATEHAIHRLLKRCSNRPETLMLDGSFSFEFPVKCHSVKKGDSRSLSIAAASIMAKVTRDRIMERLDKRYPGYDFIEHKGYGTYLHRQKISELGPCPIHRHSYEPVKSILSEQTVLFTDS